VNCRHCGTILKLPFLDLGSAPPSNAYLTKDSLHAPEQWFPLRVMVCEQCWLVQTEDFSRPDSLFAPDYAYFSSFSDSWLEHTKLYVQMMVNKFDLGPNSIVIEVAANDGYLLQYVRKAGIPCLGIEPTAGTAQAAREKGLTIVEDFFSEKLAKTLAEKDQTADLMTANNVLAHVPNINDFVKGFAILLKPSGVATFEFPHILHLVQKNQFDTIYHEHYSYLSITTTNTIFSLHGLHIFDVEKLTTHGGSLRIYAQRADTGQRERSQRVDDLLHEEKIVGISEAAFYGGLQERVERIKNDLLLFLIDAKRRGLSVAAYGAAAKGNTLINFAGIRADLISYVADRNPAKQGKFMPGSRIPIVDEAYLKCSQPDRVLILPWNLRNEVINQLEYIKEWGGRFVTAIPSIMII
jgi:hypothetical protein